MIDLHFHCLPGIDDGPATFEESVALCREAARQGTDRIVATPHVLRPPWLNEDRSNRDDLLLRLNTLLGGKPAILPGCEYFFSSDAVDLWEQGEDGPLTGLNRSTYLLVEFDSVPFPATAASAMLHEFSILGVVPVLAHPERHPDLSGDLDYLASLVARGARVQVTAAAIAGDFGPRAVAVCRELLGRRLVHLVASDAHSVKNRPPRLAAAREKVSREWGREMEDAIFETNPASVLASEPLAWAPPVGPAP